VPASFVIAASRSGEPVIDLTSTRRGRGCAEVLLAARDRFE
jgi:hypothetical protein